MKRFAAIILILALLVPVLAGCGSAPATTEGPSTTETPAVTTTEEPTTEAPTTEEPTTVEPTTEPAPTLHIVDDVDTTGYEQVGRLYFKVPEGWTRKEEEGEEQKHVYQFINGDTFAYVNVAFQDELGYLPNTIEAAYEEAIATNVGPWDGMEEEEIGWYNWRHYIFEKGTAFENVCADVYLCTDGNMAVYFEFAASAELEKKMKDSIRGVLESAVIK